MASPARQHASSSVPDKPLPQNLDAERNVLGAILLDGIQGKIPNQALAAALNHVTFLDFVYPLHQKCLRLMVRLNEAGEPIDLVTLIEEFKRDGDLNSLTGEETAYLAQLADGLPKLSNVPFHAKLIAEKSRLRSTIKTFNQLQEQAFEKDADSAAILQTLDSFIKNSVNGHQSDRKLIAADLLDFLTMNLDPIDFIIEPILPVNNSMMIYSPTGAGKTYVMLYMAYAVAIGAPDCFVWPIPKARPVVYTDGEMDASTLQERLTEIARGWGNILPSRTFFKTITPDLQPKFPPRINTKEGRLRIEEHLQEGCLQVLDNLSTLCPGGDEEESEDWAAIQEWILYLRRKKIATAVVHHAGKSGAQLGTSKKEHQLSSNLRLKSTGRPEEGLKVEARLDKLRRRGKDGRFEEKWSQPFEISLRVDDGAASFSIRPMLELLRQKAIRYLQAGMRESEVVLETGLTRYQIYRLKQKLKTEGINAELD
jgi:AAA domain/DnaB-like helicase N terminal domain